MVTTVKRWPQPHLAHRVRDEAGNEDLVGAIVDITEHKVADEAIRRSDAYLAEAQGLSHTGSFGWKPDTGEIVWSDETYRIFEYDRAQTPHLDMVLKRIHPQDKALAQQIVESVSASGSDFEHECRLLAIRRIRSRTSLDAGGRPGPCDFQRQKRRKPRRCQRRTVSGRTMTRTWAQCAQTSESHAQKILSALLSRSRLGLARRRTASCWRRARFSRARSLRVRTREHRDPRTATSTGSTAGFCPDSAAYFRGSCAHQRAGRDSGQAHVLRQSATRQESDVRVTMLRGVREAPAESDTNVTQK